MSEAPNDLVSFKNPRLVSEDSGILVIRDDNRFGDVTSWPNADPEIFIEEAAKSYDKDARRIHIRNRVEGGALTVMSSLVAATALQEFFQTKNPLYLLGVPAGIAGGAFGLHLPNNHSTQDVQAAYKQDAETIRQMPRQIHHE
jgi:hypothetical protein